MIQALEEGNIEKATTYFVRRERKDFQRFWKYSENPYLKQIHLLRTPLSLVKMETGKLTLESTASQEESAPSTKLRVEFVRGYENGNQISSFEILPNNHDLELEFNTKWIEMWNGLEQKKLWKAEKHYQFYRGKKEFFYVSHVDKQQLTLRQWRRTQKAIWTKLAKQFKVSLTLVDRCDNRISLVHVFPPKSGKKESTYLEVNFSKDYYKTWKIEQFQLHSQSLPRSFAKALKDSRKGKDFELCEKNEEFVTKDDPSISDRIRHLLGFQ